MSQDSNGQGRISSGIVELDRILGGGFPIGTFCSVEGDIGTGTTTFCAQVVWSRLLSGGLATYICLDETPARIVEQFRSFGYDLEPYIQKGALLIQEGQSFLNSLASAAQGQNGIAERRNLLSRFLLEFNKKICAARRLNVSNRLPAVSVVDSFSSIAPYIDLKSAYVLAHMIASSARRHGNLLLAVAHTGPIESNVLCACNAAADSIIRFRKIVTRGVLKRFIQIEKMTFASTPEKVLEFNITGERGLQLVNELTAGGGRDQPGQIEIGRIANPADD